MSPALALLLVHDLLLANRGIAAPETHPLRAAVTRHRARLAAELTKARVKRGFASIADLRAYMESSLSLELGPQDKLLHSGNVPCGSVAQKWSHPRWVRINTLRTTLDEQLNTTFTGYTLTDSICQLTRKPSGASVEKLLHVDRHIPNLVAVAASTKLSNSAAYKDGLIILQDKASCFPAYLLDPHCAEGAIVDACAAPGNKTTHLATLLHGAADSTPIPKVWACERDKGRSATLRVMVNMVGAADIVNIKAGQDFLALNPQKKPWDEIGSLLLDPSCSGSGIVGRDDMPHVFFPEEYASNLTKSKSLKRKRQGGVFQIQTKQDSEEKPSLSDRVDDTDQLSVRLDPLSAFQLKLLLHTFQFPKARKVVYSTCSIHAQENEHVVLKALDAPISREGNWRILRREEQVCGAQDWPIRGDRDAYKIFSGIDGMHDLRAITDACIRCEKGTDEGTQGFFVAAFVRDNIENISCPDHGNFQSASAVASNSSDVNACQSMPGEGEQEWEGFSDEE